ncbi:M81 family metallopeptidase [Nitratireductor sp. OM-1]|uniref:M81 family metallopeptidase n=1 Tax=Nitratireductor sp. OM-1 TaxID=1756988 RepID=UPI000DDC3322|nr:M81 family metallopeptidase [Nitratireductor sp. OM-1]
MRIGVARLWHEANSFSVCETGLEQFQAREWVRGEEARELYRGTATEPGGALAWAEQRENVELVFSRCASAAPAGPVDQALLDRLTQEIVEDASLDGIDGLYLSLHGACIGTADLDPELTLVKALRQRFPDLPIAASFDMHACIAPELAGMLNAATIYRTYPHVDMAETAQAALDMLARMVEEELKPRVILRRIGRILPSFNMRTDGPGPMRDIEAKAQILAPDAAAAPFPAAYPYASFAYADVPVADAGVLVTCLDEAEGSALADEVAAFMLSQQARFQPDLPSAYEALAACPWASGARVAFLEPSDNPLSGGIGDTPGLFAAALETDLPEGSVFAFFCDPDLVTKAHEAGAGATLEVSLGGRLDDRFGEPLRCMAKVLCVTDGRFRNEDAMERGMPVDLGPTALIGVNGLRVIVTTGCQSPNDTAYFRLHGIDIDTVPVLLAKAKNHFRAAFGSRFDVIQSCETLGPAMADVSQLPFRNVPRERFNLKEQRET